MVPPWEVPENPSGPERVTNRPFDSVSGLGCDMLAVAYRSRWCDERLKENIDSVGVPAGYCRLGLCPDILVGRAGCDHAVGRLAGCYDGTRGSHVFPAADLEATVG